MAKFRFLQVAQSEYDRAFDWYLDKSTRAAERFVTEVETAVESIRKHPDQQLRWDNTYRFRMLNKFPYFVAFRQSVDEVVIVAIRHTSQDQDAWQGR
ncbi:MAG: type II toxin-antitoxin system RelE/ParE family toxin [Pirellulales bacterium]